MELKSIRSDPRGLSSAAMRDMVLRAREIQNRRYAGSRIRFNSDLSGREIEEYCRLGTAEQEYISSIYDKLGLSARSYHRVLRVARTIADLEGSDDLTRKHLLEAVYYRPGLEYWKG